MADDVVVATAGYTAGLGVLRGRVLPGAPAGAGDRAAAAASALAALGWPGREGVVEARRIFNYFRLTADDRLVFGGAAPRYHWRGRPPAGEARHLAGSLRRELAGVFPRGHRLRSVAGDERLERRHRIHAGRPPGASAAIASGPAVVHALGWCGHGLALSVASGAWIARMVFEDRPLDGAWVRDRSPLLPGEAVRWLSFRAAVGAMAVMDRVA